MTGCQKIDDIVKWIDISELIDSEKQREDEFDYSLILSNLRYEGVWEL